MYLPLTGGRWTNLSLFDSSGHLPIAADGGRPPSLLQTVLGAGHRRKLFLIWCPVLLYLSVYLVWWHGRPSLYTQHAPPDFINNPGVTPHVGSTAPLSADHDAFTLVQPSCPTCPIQQWQFDEASSSVTGCATFDFNRALEGITWIAYAGDSLLRSPFFTWMDLLVGKAWEAERRQFSMTTYHSDHLFCCRDVTDASTCLFQRQGIELNETEQAVTSISHFLQRYDKRVDKHLLCVSWLWAPNPDKALLNHIQRFQHAPTPPDIVVVNPGLHPLLARWSFEVLQQRFTDMYNAMLTATKVASHTTFLVHEVTYLHEESLAPHKRHDMMTNAAIAKLNAIARNIITKTPHPRVRQVPTFALTRDGDVEPMGDGLHYKGHYQSLIANIDLFYGTSQCQLY